MAALKISKISGATLIEVIVSMVLIMTIFGIATMIYINVLNSSVSERQLRITFLLKKVGEDTILSKRFFDEELVEQEFKIHKTISPYNTAKNLFRLHLEIADGNKIISRDQLIISESNEED